MDPVVLRYADSIEHDAAFVHHALGTYGRRTWRDVGRNALLAGVCSAVLASLGAVWGTTGVIAAVAFGLLLELQLTNQRRDSPDDMRRWLERFPQPPPGDVVVTLSEDGVVVEERGKRRELTWPAIANVELTPAYLFVSELGNVGFAIPASALPTMADRERLVAVVGEKVAAAGMSTHTP